MLSILVHRPSAWIASARAARARRPRCARLSRFTAVLCALLHLLCSRCCAANSLSSRRGPPAPSSPFRPARVHRRSSSQRAVGWRVSRMPPSEIDANEGDTRERHTPATRPAVPFAPEPLRHRLPRSAHLAPASICLSHTRIGPHPSSSDTHRRDQADQQRSCARSAFPRCPLRGIRGA